MKRHLTEAIKLIAEETFQLLVDPFHRRIHRELSASSNMLQGTSLLVVTEKGAKVGTVPGRGLEMWSSVRSMECNGRKRRRAV